MNEYQARYQKSEKGKATAARYFKSKKGKMALARYADSEKGKETIFLYQNSKKGKQARRRARRKYAEKNGIDLVKRDARSAVSHALSSGKIKKMPCEVCRNENVHGHHDDYSKPLKVRWLCPVHHRAEHLT